MVRAARNHYILYVAQAQNKKTADGFRRSRVCSALHVAYDISDGFCRFRIFPNISYHFSPFIVHTDIQIMWWFRCDQSMILFAFHDINVDKPSVVPYAMSTGAPWGNSLTALAAIPPASRHMLAATLAGTSCWWRSLPDLLPKCWPDLLPDFWRICQNTKRIETRFACFLFLWHLLTGDIKWSQGLREPYTKICKNCKMTDLVLRQPPCDYPFVGCSSWYPVKAVTHD